MRPWRAESLQDFIDKRTAGWISRYELYPGIFGVGDEGGGATTWGEAATVDPRYVTEVTWSRLDSQHTNAVTIGVPGQGENIVGTIQRAGFPIKGIDDIRRNGLRMYRPKWPFYPPFDSDDADVPNDGAERSGGSLHATQPTWMDHLRTVAAQAAQFQAGASRFRGGTVQLEDLPPVSLGVPFSLDTGVIGRKLSPGPSAAAGALAAAAATAAGAALAAAAASAAGQIAGQHAPIDTLVGYTESITRTIMVKGGSQVVAKTSFTFTRGLFDESVRPLAFDLESGAEPLEVLE